MQSVLFLFLFFRCTIAIIVFWLDRSRKQLFRWRFPCFAAILVFLTVNWQKKLFLRQSNWRIPTMTLLLPPFLTFPLHPPLALRSICDETRFFSSLSISRIKIRHAPKKYKKPSFMISREMQEMLSFVCQSWARSAVASLPHFVQLHKKERNNKSWGKEEM